MGGRLGNMKEAARAPLGRISGVAPLSLLCVGRKTGGKIQREKVEDYKLHLFVVLCLISYH